ncbi:MAG: helix-turn-helix domain-containing protein [Acetivibrio sp.]
MEVEYKSEYRREIAELIASGNTVSEIAKYFGVKAQTISNKLCEMRKNGEIADTYDGRKNQKANRKVTNECSVVKKPKTKVNLSDKAIGLSERICPICKKKFWKNRFEWGWCITTRSGKKDVCSYTCQRKFEKSATVRKNTM